MTDEVNYARNGVLGKVAGRANEGKSLLHTIHPDFILGIGRISAFGAKKYHSRNWLMAPGMAWSSVYESLLRHLLAWQGGEEVDAESGLSHLLHAAWNLMALYTYSIEEAYAPGDDRPSRIEWQGHRWQDWRSQFEEEQTCPSAIGEAAAALVGPTGGREGPTERVDDAPGTDTPAAPEATPPGLTISQETALTRVRNLEKYCITNRRRECTFDLKDISALLDIIATHRGE